MDYEFEQQGRRPIVAIAAVLGLCMVIAGFVFGAPWYFIAIPALSALMALAIFLQNSRSGLRIEGNALTLFKDQWRHVIEIRTIRGVRVNRWSDGQPSVWLDFDQGPPYRLPGYCF